MSDEVNDTQKPGAESKLQSLVSRLPRWLDKTSEQRVFEILNGTYQVMLASLLVLFATIFVEWKYEEYVRNKEELKKIENDKLDFVKSERANARDQHREIIELALKRVLVTRDLLAEIIRLNELIKSKEESSQNIKKANLYKIGKKFEDVTWKNYDEVFKEWNSVYPARIASITKILGKEKFRGLKAQVKKMGDVHNTVRVKRKDIETRNSSEWGSWQGSLEAKQGELKSLLIKLNDVRDQIIRISYEFEDFVSSQKFKKNTIIRFERNLITDENSQ